LVRHTAAVARSFADRDQEAAPPRATGVIQAEATGAVVLAAPWTKADTVEPNPGGPAEFAKSIDEQRAVLTKAAKDLGITPK